MVRLADLEDPDGHRIRLAAHPEGFGWPPPEAQSEDDAPPADPLAALSWLEGKWEGANTERRWEEHWSAAQAGAMVGMFRMLEGDRPIVYELLLIEAVAESREDGPDAMRVVCNLRHFGAKMKAWEDAPIVLDLVEASDTLILFRNRSEDKGPTFVRYSRNGPHTADAWVGATPEVSTPDQGFTLSLRRTGR